MSLSPGDYAKRIFFSNSGAESVECGIKAAKYGTARPGMLAFVGGFHGRTMGALALTTSSAVARRRYTSSLMPDVAFAPYAYCYRCPFNQREDTCGLECLRYLEEWVLHKVMPVEDCAAMIVEPIQGAGPSSVRLAPPLILTDAQIDIGLSIMEEVLSSYSR